MLSIWFELKSSFLKLLNPALAMGLTSLIFLFSAKFKISRFLKGHRINDSIEALSKSPLEKLKMLKLSKNKIIDIEALKNPSFKNLEQLDLFDNQIKNIDEVFNGTSFNENIKELDLSYNCLESIEVLVENKNFPKLKDLNIEGNSNLDYTNKNKDKNISKLFDNYGINYTFNPIIKK